MKKKHITLYDLLGMNKLLKTADSSIAQNINNQFKDVPKVKPQNDFLAFKTQLTSFLKQYSPKDLIVAINIIELWLPNISSAFKQSILVNTFLSIPERKFKGEKTLITYKEFESFTKQLIDMFPDFPMMEDYVPEIDWGEVKFELNNDFYQIFYGGVIERVPDFLQAFLIVHGDKPSAINSALCALRLQDHIIKQLEKTIIIPDSIDRGHWETPSIQFWSECKRVLESFDEYIQDIPTILITALGKEKNYSSISEFSNAFMQSKVNQNIFVKISGKYYPFSIRNCLSVAIDKVAKEPVEAKGASFRLLNFINRRINTSAEQPLQLFDTSQLYSTVLTAVFHTQNKLYFVIILDDDEDTAEIFEENLRNAIQSDYWGFKLIDAPYAFNIRNEGEAIIPREKIEILYLTGGVTTAMDMGRIPKSGIVFPFSEFISIFDSVENTDEIASFIDFVEKHKSSMFSPMNSLADMFGSYKDSYGVLEKGATQYDLIALDPHTGSNWRYKYLSDYWEKLIVDVPDKKTKWIPKNSYDDIQFLGANDRTKYSWSTKVEKTNIHFIVQIDEFINLPQVNGRMLNFFAESATDALSQRRDIVSQLSIVQQYQKIVFECVLDKEYVINDKGEVESIDINFFDNLSWEVFQYQNDSKETLAVSISINVSAMKNEIEKSVDSEFQGLLAKVILEIIYEINDTHISESTIKALKETYKNKTRVSIGSRRREFDSLESFHSLPEAEHYLTARKELAKIIKDAGYEEKRYELALAKQVINDIASRYLFRLQELLKAFDKNQLIIKVLNNYDAYIYYKYSNSYRAIQSLEHEVAFDREESAYDLQHSFSKNSNNFRYLIERLVANKVSGSNEPLHEDMLLIIAYVDWLMVLYSASEVLHHGIDVGGIEIDNEYIPEVLFSEESKKYDYEFGLEQAGNNLGIGVNEDDEVIGVITENLLNQLNLAFEEDVGFSFATLIMVLDVLQSWADITKIELSNHYSTSLQHIADTVLKLNNENQNINNLSIDEVLNSLSFLTLDSERVLKKLGSEIDEFDVPVLEYNKRDQRLNIKPIINIDNDNVLWSAGCAYRTRNIWLNRIAEGVLPVNFPWKSVNSVVDSLKASIENQLEHTAFDIFNRHFDSKFCQHGIDFKRKFKKEGFDDVGDYDVLTYVPYSNTWIMVECKYNQTPYCIQDMRRLRERIFGDSKKAHIPKIIKRYNFLKENHSKICKLLSYPDQLNNPPNVVMLYVTREIYWIHRRPPHPTDINFVQVDKLDTWLSANKEKWVSKA